MTRSLPAPSLRPRPRSATARAGSGSGGPLGSQSPSERAYGYQRRSRPRRSCWRPVDPAVKARFSRLIAYQAPMSGSRTRCRGSVSSAVPGPS